MNWNIINFINIINTMVNNIMIFENDYYYYYYNINRNCYLFFINIIIFHLRNYSKRKKLDFMNLIIVLLNFMIVIVIN